MPESEARKLAVVFEEEGRFQKEQQRKAERSNTTSAVRGPGWETDFVLEDDDPPDYYSRPDITEGAEYED